MATTTTGQAAYEADVLRTPNYRDGAPRKAWQQLGELERSSWARPAPLPTPKFFGFLLRCKPCGLVKRVELEGDRKHGHLYSSPANDAAVFQAQIHFGPPRPWLSPGRALGIFDVVCGCARRVKTEQVRGTYRPEVKCDGRCTHAKGPDCQCSCGGKNHGSGW